MKDFKFDKLAANYDEGYKGSVSQKFYKLLMKEITLQSGDKVLDVGCGTGTLLGYIASAVDIEGCGVDAEEKMIEVAREKHKNIEFSVASCDKLPFDGQKFEAVIACMAYHHFNNKDGFAMEAARVLKPGGVLYIVDPLFPLLMRKIINGILRLFRITGNFYTPQEIESRFAKYGFTGIGIAIDTYAQVVKLKSN